MTSRGDCGGSSVDNGFEDHPDLLDTWQILEKMLMVMIVIIQSGGNWIFDSGDINGITMMGTLCR